MGQSQIGRLSRLRNLVWVARSGEHRVHARLVEQPGQCQGRHRCVNPGAEAANPFKRRESFSLAAGLAVTGLGPLFGKVPGAGPPFRHFVGRGEFTGQESLCQRAIAQNPDSRIYALVLDGIFDPSIPENIPESSGWTTPLTCLMSEPVPLCLITIADGALWMPWNRRQKLSHSLP